MMRSELESIQISGKQSTHSSQEPKDKPDPTLDAYPDLREGWVGHLSWILVPVLSMIFCEIFVRYLYSTE